METAQRRQTISKLSRIPGYAGGGFIDGLKQAVGMAPQETMIQKFARQDAERAAKQKPAPEQAQPPKPDNAIGNYVGNTALQAREKAAGLSGGGPVEGEGGPTQDNIPIKASVGEFMIRAAAVKEIGLPALRAINALGGNLPKSPNRKDAKYAEGDLINPKVTGFGPNTTEGMAARQTVHQSQLDSANTLAANNLSKGALPVPTPSGPSGQVADPVAKHNAELASAQSLATARASGANPTPASESAGRAAYADALQRSNALASTSYFQQQTPTSNMDLSGAKKSATDALAGVYATPSKPIAAVQAVAQPGATTAPAMAPAGIDPATYVSKPAANNTFRQSDAPASLSEMSGKDLGSGIKRFDVEGKSPLFTNRTDAVGMADNAALTNRAPMTAQNQMAMQGIQDRQDAGDKARAAQSQYEQEVAQAQAINQGQKEYHLQHDAASGNSSQRRAALAALANISTAATTKANNAVSMRGQDVTSRGQDLTANAMSASQKLARDQFGLSQAKDGRESAASAMDIKARQQLMDAQQEYLAAGDDPVKQKAAERKLSTLGIKQAQDEYAYAPGGQAVVDGQLVTQPGVVFNKRTGQPAQAGKSIQSDQRALAIKNNANLTREQKVAELQKIGFQ